MVYKVRCTQSSLLAMALEYVNSQREEAFNGKEERFSKGIRQGKGRTFIQWLLLAVNRVLFSTRRIASTRCLTAK